MGNVLLNGFLNWRAKMLQVMFRYQASMLFLARGISVRILNSKGRNEV
jgi:hypothetical protein